MYTDTKAHMHRMYRHVYMLVHVRMYMFWGMLYPKCIHNCRSGHTRIGKSFDAHLPTHRHTYMHTHTHNTFIYTHTCV